MSTLYPDNLPDPREPQGENFEGEPPAHQNRSDHAEVIRRDEFRPVLVPERPVRSDARTLFHWMDLVYLILFYFVCGGLLTLVVAAGAFVFFGISPSELKNSTAAWASVLIISQALLSGATLAFLYAVVRGRSSAPFWQSLGWRGFRNMISHASIVL